MYELAFKILNNIEPHYKKDRLLNLPEIIGTDAMGNINDNNTKEKIHFPLAEARQASNHWAQFENSILDCLPLGWINRTSPFNYLIINDPASDKSRSLIFVN